MMSSTSASASSSDMAVSATGAASKVLSPTIKNKIASCVCGQFKLHIQGDIAGRISICHCFSCQQRTGSVFGCQTRFLVNQVEEKGECKVYTRIGDSGGQIDYKFCSTCGSTLCWQIRSEGYENFIIVAIGSLRDPSIGQPTFSVYSSGTRKHAWVKLPDEMEVLD